MANALSSAPWETNKRTCASVLATIQATDRHFPLLMVDGWHNESQFEDLMHDDLLGLRLHANGAVLEELCRNGHWGSFSDVGIWTERLDAQLKVAYLDFSDFVSALGVSHSQPLFTHLQLTLKTLSSKACLKAKAKNSQLVGVWLCSVCDTQLSTLHDEVRAAMMQGFNETWNIVHATRWPNWILSDSQVSQLNEARGKLLLGYHWLAKESVRLNRWNAFSLIPKFHKLDHCFNRSMRTKVSPSIYWTFVLEHQMGISARLVSKLHPHSSYRRGVERYLLFLFACVFSDKVAESQQAAPIREGD